MPRWMIFTQIYSGMNLVNVHFPEALKTVSNAKNHSEPIIFAKQFKKEFDKGGLYVLDFEGDIPNIPQGLFFDDFIVHSGVLRVYLQGIPKVSRIIGNVKLFIRKISKYYLLL